MKWILPILFLLAFITSNGQSKDSVVCLPKGDIITLANRIKGMRDTINWLNETIVWQKNIITEQDTLIGQQGQQFSVCQTQLENRQNVIGIMEQENKKLREVIDLLQPKWYNNKWLWFGGGAAVVTAIVSVIK